ncbi:hypothetical protein [Synechococcus sp. PCC 6312]|uniref:hypothetical protein n=1 Tax=Synechococcus sp. (strain ATCC 27167 / PCC 6312) TaxID=195253 RepID=UPI00029EEBB6|nr:hypothetical protein [Synechococcus sp. PCC 6312]AFY61181.1 hypothetical protein Syn6312_2050 [Synechococcus sp. PCC 6312]
MRTTLRNEALLERLRPGLILEAYACRDDDPLLVLPDRPIVSDINNDFDVIDDNKNAQRQQKETPVQNDPRVVENSFKISDQFLTGKGYEVKGDDYLEASPYLLIRGIISAFGRTTSVSEGSASTVLQITGESYGQVYQNAVVLFDTYARVSTGRAISLEATRFPSKPLVVYYMLLRHFVEKYWDEPTGWIARTRIPLMMPYQFAIPNQNTTVWGGVRALFPEAVNGLGLSVLFVDHTGAIVSEKQPFSGRDQALVDPYFLAQIEGAKGQSQGQLFPDAAITKRLLRNWEDLPLYELPSWQVVNWADRLTQDHLSNYVKVVSTPYSGSGAGGEQSSLPATPINVTSIKTYGGVRPIPLNYPLETTFYKQSAPDPFAGNDSRAAFAVSMALEVLRWTEYAIRRVQVQVRGQAHFRPHTRLRLYENWHDPSAEPKEYYVVGRTHSLDFARGGWTTILDLIQDRRDNLPLGVTESTYWVLSGTRANGTGFETITTGQLKSYVESRIEQQQIDQQPARNQTGGIPIPVPTPQAR